MRNLKWILTFSGVFLYTLFWIWFFAAGENKPLQTELKPEQAFAQSLPDPKPTERIVKSSEQKIETQDKIIALPERFSLDVTPRRQFFNLSCEFAAASSIIYYYTGLSDFKSSNQENAERTLIEKTPISKNPNIGIRMGEESVTLSDIFDGLGQKFGGDEYYGIHAPPFIDIFESYGLTTQPIFSDQEVLRNLKEALYKGHLVMAWIKLGFGENVDKELSYGKVKIIKGEHAVVILGFDKTGFRIMDVGSGSIRHITSESLLSSSASFSVPFLEVFPSDDSDSEILSLGKDKLTQLERNTPKISITNSSGIAGAGDKLRDILSDFGYSIADLRTIKSDGQEFVSVNSKKRFSDFLEVIRRDLEISGYIISEERVDVSEDSQEDITIQLGI